MRKCLICRDSRLEEIDVALVEDRLSLRAMTARFGHSPTSLRRHRANHVLPVIIARYLEVNPYSTGLLAKLAWENLLRSINGETTASVLALELAYRILLASEGAALPEKL